MVYADIYRRCRLVLMKSVWDWMTQIAMAYALATILCVVFSLMFNATDKALLILENDPFIRRIEIWGGIFSFVVLLVNFFIKFGMMAERR